MRTRLFFAVFFSAAFLFSTAQAANSPRSEWFRFTLAEDPDPASPANAGRTVLDAPAGKHGFLRTNGENFVFEDGTPAKFWGTNFGSHISFPAKDEAKSLARRLAFLGFNIVRLHHMDMYDEPGGIFKAGSSTLSPAQLDRLDYLVHELKQRGIYVNINLLTLRRFHAADGVAEAEKVQAGGKPVSYFDPKIIELQKKFALDLLGHKNPYTGLRYADDPAVAFVELTNENSIFDFWKWDNLNGYLGGLKKGSIPPYYVEELDRLWEGWLKKKNRPFFKRPLFATRDLLSPEQRADIQTFYIELEKNFFIEMTHYLRNELGVRAAVTGIGGYCHEYDLKALEATDFIDTHSYYDHPGFPRGWNKNDFTLGRKSLLLDNPEKFIGNISASRVKGKPLTLSEWNQCYPNPYAYEMPLLVAAGAVQNNWAAIYQFAWSMGRSFELHAGNIDSFFHISQNAQQMLLCLAGSVIFHASEDIKTNIKNGVLTVTSKNAVAAVGFIKDKIFEMNGVTIRSAENGAVVLFSPEKEELSKARTLVFLTIGEIKNRDSRWDGDRFFWGGPWSELKKIPAEISFKTEKKFRVYALKENGLRGEELKAGFKDGALNFSTERSKSPWFEITVKNQS